MGSPLCGPAFPQLGGDPRRPGNVLYVGRQPERTYWLARVGTSYTSPQCTVRRLDPSEHLSQFPQRPGNPYKAS